MNNRDKILTCALDLFSLRGYDAVSMREIAAAVGIKESSIYNHYKNKQDIFNSILALHEQHGGEFFQNMQLTGEDGQFAADDRTLGFYAGMTDEQFALMGAAIFDFYFSDELNAKVRRMLTIEQYRSEELAQLYRRISFDDSINYQSILFGALMQAGFLRKTDPYVLALNFFAPIYLLFYKYDNREESLKEAKELFLRHVRHFQNTYSINHNGGVKQ